MENAEYFAHPVRFSIDVSAICTDRGVRGLSKDQRDKFFVMCTLPTGENIKSEIFTHNKTTWVFSQDVNMELTSLRKFSNTGLDFVLFKQTGSPSKVTNDHITDAMNDETTNISTNNSTGIRKKILESLKTKSARIRHNPLLLEMRSVPQPHHHDLPDKTLLPNVQFVSRSTGGSKEDPIWNIGVVPGATIAVTGEQPLDANTIPYERSTTPPFPHHYDLPEKHHHRSPLPSSSSRIESQTHSMTRGPQPHHSNIIDKCQKTRPKNVEIHEYVAKFSLDRQSFLLGKTDQEISASFPQWGLESIKIRLTLDKPLLDKNHIQILNVSQLAITAFDPREICPPNTNIKSIYISVKFVDGRRYDFIPHRFNDHVAIFQDTKVVFMSDLGLETLLHSDIEFTVYVKRNGMFEPSARSYLNLRNMLLSKTTHQKYTLELQSLESDVLKMSKPVRPALKFKISMARSLDFPQNEVEKVWNFDQHENNAIGNFTKSLKNPVNVPRIVLHSQDDSQTKMALYVVQELNMKVLNMDIHFAKDVEKFKALKLSKNQRMSKELVSGLWISAGSESFMFLETSLAYKIANDARLAKVKWQVLNGPDCERQFGGLEPKLFHLALPMPFSDLVTDGKNYLKRNRIVLDTINKLEMIRRGDSYSYSFITQQHVSSLQGCFS